MPLEIGVRTLLDLAFLLFAGFTALITLAFYYHWARYAPSTFSSMTVMIIYSVGAAVFLLGMLGSLSGV